MSSTTTNTNTTAAAVTKRRNVRRKFLGIGINEYENPNNNLSGCVSDVKDMAQSLRTLGFPASKQKLLLNEQATTQGILWGLDWLIKDIADGDVLVFYYSGHGSQVADLNDEEHDRLDEILCPYDISWNDEKYVTDDMLYEYFTKKLPKGVRTDVLLDSCFSGSATRAAIIGGQLQDTSSFRTGGKKQRYLPPPVNHQNRLYSMIPAITDKTRLGIKTVTETQNNVLWSGCQEYQVSWEMMLGQEVRGAFTYHFTQMLREVQGNMTRGEIYSQLRSQMANNGFEQVPNLEIPNVEALELFPFRKFSEIDRAEELVVKKK